MLLCARLRRGGLLLLLLLAALHEVRGYSSGAPDSVCESMTPSHGQAPQTTPAPYQVIPGAASVQDEPLSVTLAAVSPTGSFKGFLVQARDANSSAIVGRFLPGAAKLLSCSGGVENAATHQDGTEKQSVVLQWQPPLDYAGDVILRATVVQSYEVFWTGLTSEKVTVSPSTATAASTTTTTAAGIDVAEGAAAGAPPSTAVPPAAGATTRRRGLLNNFRGRPTTAAPPTPTPATPAAPTRNIAVAGSTAPLYVGCGVNKGCFGQPVGCVDTYDCSVLFTYARGSGGDYDFEVVGTATSGQYAAGGLSFDEHMGSDSVAACRSYNGEASLVMTYNDGKSNVFLENPHDGVRGVETSLVDGQLLCRYTRAARTQVNGLVFDLDNSTFFLQVAQGPLATDGSLNYHDAKLVSSQSTSLGSVQNLGAASNIFLVLHACFMVAAWVGAASSGIFIARYFKQTWKNYKACNIDQWFHCHRFFMILTWSLTMAAFGLILWHVNGWTQIPAEMNPHAYIGVVSIGLCFIQPFMAVLRCGPQHPRRPLFNWLHWGVGNAAQILGITAIFYGLDLYGLPRWTWWIMIAFVGVHCVLHLLMSVGECVSDSKAKRQVSGGMAMSELNGSRDMLQPPKDYIVDAPGATFRKVVLALYLAAVWLASAALIVVIVAGQDKLEDWGLNFE